MGVAWTSKLAYREIVDKLAPRQARVLNVIRRYGPLSNEDIALALDSKINEITPRTLELRQRGLVMSDAVGVSMAGRKVKLWRLTDEVKAKSRGMHV